MHELLFPAVQLYQKRLRAARKRFIEQLDKKPLTPLGGIYTYKRIEEWGLKRYGDKWVEAEKLLKGNNNKMVEDEMRNENFEAIQMWKPTKKKLQWLSKVTGKSMSRIMDELVSNAEKEQRIAQKLSM